jgi:DNA polymerase III epsilon subunit family exonuclease
MSVNDIDALFSLLNTSRFVAIDFETTGLSSATERIVEIGAYAFYMKYHESKWHIVEDGSFETLVNPEMPILPDVSAIHGIRDEDVASAPVYAKAASGFFNFLGSSSILIAHNARFDMGFLKSETERACLPVPQNPAYDTVELARTAITGLPSYSLGALVKSFDIPQTARHRGLSDAWVCTQIFVHCVNLLEKKNCNKHIIPSSPHRQLQAMP